MLGPKNMKGDNSRKLVISMGLGYSFWI